MKVNNGLIKNKQYKAMQAIGRISIGMKVEKNGVEYPQAIDWFRATGNYSELFHAAFGEKPNQLEIRFLSDNPVDSCCNYYEIRKGSKVYARGDGAFFQVSDGKGNFEEKVICEKFEESDWKKEVEEICSTEKHRGEWKSRLDLKFMIEGLYGVWGYWNLTTYGEASSINNLVMIYHKIRDITHGRIRGLKFNLSVKFHKRDVAVEKKEYQRKYPVLALEPLHSIETLRFIAQAVQEEIELPFFIEEKQLLAIESKIEDNDFEDAKILLTSSENLTQLNINAKTIAGFKKLTESEKIILRDIYSNCKIKLEEKG